MDLAAHLASIAAARRSLPVRRTERLLLRPWREEDREPFARMNADPEVMELVGGPISRDASDAQMEHFRARAAACGLGIWALEDRATRGFVGMVGLWIPEWDAPFLPGVELVWRMVRARWGEGLATEAARDALAYAVDGLGLPRVMAWTTPENRRSWRVMERLGMVPDGTFVHPRLAADDPRVEHIRYVFDAPSAHARVTMDAAAAPAEAVGLGPLAAAPMPATSLPRVWLDGDGCPRVVKEIVYKAAHRGVIDVTIVANRDIVVPRSPRIRAVRVGQGLDVADDWVVAHAAPGDLVVTSDVPMAAELVPRGVDVITPRGERFTPANIREKLSLRDYFTEAREAGVVEGTGPAPFDERAKRAFANGLDRWIAARRG